LTLTLTEINDFNPPEALLPATSAVDFYCEQDVGKESNKIVQVGSSNNSLISEMTLLL